VSSSAPRPRNFLASGKEESSGNGRFRRFCDGKDCLEVGDSTVVGFIATTVLLLFCRLETRLSRLVPVLRRSKAVFAASSAGVSLGVPALVSGSAMVLAGDGGCCFRLTATVVGGSDLNDLDPDSEEVSDSDLSDLAELSSLLSELGVRGTDIL